MLQEKINQCSDFGLFVWKNFTDYLTVCALSFGGVFSVHVWIKGGFLIRILFPLKCIQILR